MYYIGIDWEDKGYAVIMVNERGETETDLLDIEKKKDDFDELIQWIREKAKNTEDVLIGIERDRDNLADFLLSFGYKLYLIDPNQIKSFRKRYSHSGKKDDVFDTYVIANAVRTDRNHLREIKKKSETIRRVEFLYRQRHTAVNDRKRLINRLKSFLKQYFPVFLDFFSNIDRPTALAFLQEYPTLKDVKSLRREDIRTFLRSHKYYSSRGVKKIWKVLQQEQIEVDALIVTARKEAVVALTKRIQLLNKEIVGYERELEEILDKEKDGAIFKSLPGAAVVMASGLMMIFGEDRERYSDRSEIASLSGIVPVTRQSGKYKKVFFRFGCNHLFRNIFTTFAFTSIKKSSWARAKYNKYRGDGKTHYHALRCLANAWLKVIFALWEKGEKYDENKHLAASTRRKISKDLRKKTA